MMITKPTNDPAMRNLERGIRFEIERLILIVSVLCLVLEAGLCFYYYSIQDLGQPLNTYIEFRILVPLGVNILVYLVTRFSNRSENSTDSTKNRVCSFAGLIMLGVISLAHSYFIPLWMLPAFSILFCSIFHDDFITKIQSGVSFVFVLYSGILHIYDYPSDRNDTIICIVIAELIVLGVSFMSFKLENYNERKFVISERSLISQNKFENGFEIDSITGVYSKAYLSEEAGKILSQTNELDPSGLAVLDIDDFKEINDELGHDKGDIVLCALGSVLSGYIDESTIIGRFGGEKFVVVFSNGVREDNMNDLNQMCREFAKKKFSFTKRTVTLSGGYVWFDENIELEKAMDKAQEALARAKKSGKNRVIASDESEE